jgi:hypothetical protein
MAKMTLKGFVWLAFTAFSLPLGYAQDFSKSYTPAPGARYSIFCFSGNIKVRGYKGEQIMITAYKKGPDSKSVEITEENKAGWIIVQAKDPKFAPKFDPTNPAQSRGPFGGMPPMPPRPFSQPDRGFTPPADSGNGVDFEIQVPKSISADSLISLKCIRGSIRISNVNMQVWANCDWGDVDVENSRGNINAKSNSGAIRAELGSGKGQNFLTFESGSGEVIVKAPGNLNAQVFMKSDFGSLKTDFSLEKKENRYGPRTQANGKLGSGDQKLFISSRMGNVSLLKK